MNNKVVHIVVNSFDNDSRVIRECKTLSENGNDLTVIAYLEEGMLARESNYGFKTIRIKLFTKKWSNTCPMDPGRKVKKILWMNL